MSVRGPASGYVRMTPRKEDSVKSPMALESKRYGGGVRNWGAWAEMTTILLSLVIEYRNNARY